MDAKHPYWDAKMDAKMDAKHPLLGNKRTFGETCIMSVIIFEQKNLWFTRTTRQKSQKFVYIEKFLTYQNE